MAILLFESVCFTITELHRNSFLHNVAGLDVRSVLDHLVICDLVICVERGLKTSRRSTSVYVKRLPSAGMGSATDAEYRLLFIEKLEEFNGDYPELTLDTYMRANATVAINAVGAVLRSRKMEATWRVYSRGKNPELLPDKRRERDRSESEYVTARTRRRWNDDRRNESNCYLTRLTRPK